MTTVHEVITNPMFSNNSQVCTIDLARSDHEINKAKLTTGVDVAELLLPIASLLAPFFP